MANTKTTDENVRTVDGTEFVRLATAGNNWKASLSNIFAGLGLIVGTSTITSGTTTHVLYDNAGVLGEAANFTIASGNPSVTSGNYYAINGAFFASQDNTSLSIFMGQASGNFAATTGTNNVTIGNAAGSGITSGGNHVCIGSYAGGSLTNGTGGCVFIGTLAGNLTSGDGNFGLGGSAAYNLSSGTSNVAIGNGSMVGSGTVVSNSIGIGTFALVNIQGGNNIGIGFTAGGDITFGGSNTLIGTQAGLGISTGNWNTVVGNVTGLAAGLSSNVILGDGQGNIVFQYDPTNSIYIQNSATFFLRAKTTLTNNAAASLGTLTNAPAAGNPTKWFAIDDNGTTRYIPSW